MNRLFRENIDFLFDHFESQDICAVVVSCFTNVRFLECNVFGLNLILCCLQELQKLLDVLKLTHQFLCQDLELDSFTMMLNEIQENLSLVSFSSRLSSQVLFLICSLRTWHLSVICNVNFTWERTLLWKYGCLQPECPRHETTFSLIDVGSCTLILLGPYNGENLLHQTPV